MARLRRCRDTLSAAVSGSDREPGGWEGVSRAGEGGGLAAAAIERSRVPGSGDADAAAVVWGRGGAAVCDASQHSGYRFVSAYRTGALFEAAAGGRAGPGVRNQPQLSE